MPTSEQVDMIESVIDRFDWQKVQAYMTLVNWKFRCENPFSFNLQFEARKLLHELYEKGGVYGINLELGLIGMIMEGKPQLAFYIEFKTNVTDLQRPEEVGDKKP